MPAIYNTIRNIGKFAKATVRKGGSLIRNGIRSAYNNRDLIAKGVGIGIPILAAGSVGGIPGALGAAYAQKDDIKKLGKDIKARRAGKTKGQGIAKGDIEKIVKGVRENVGGKKIEDAKMKRLKVLAQGVEI